MMTIKNRMHNQNKIVRIMIIMILKIIIMVLKEIMILIIFMVKK